MSALLHLLHHAEMLDWCGGESDRTALCFDDINTALR
jgi:hypothetical protein